ncbi:MAG: hypothetical protein PUF07_04660 [Bacteroidales bacterium]|nr:hypothetical protein [Bacteroidales bacterium]
MRWFVDFTAWDPAISAMRRKRYYVSGSLARELAAVRETLASKEAMIESKDDVIKAKDDLIMAKDDIIRNLKMQLHPDVKD